jgi:hypothetical protein
MKRCGGIYGLRVSPRPSTGEVFSAALRSRWRFSNRRSARFETARCSEFNVVMDRLFARSKAGDLQRGEWPASGTRRTGDENGDGDLESRPLSVVDDDDVESEGRDEDQLSPDNAEVAVSGE